jgi:Fe-S-cluster containining protein
MPLHEDQLPAHWLEATRRPGVRAELEALHDYTAAAIDSRRPLCTASGRCCNFDAFGHRLYATGLETAYTVALLKERRPLLTTESLRAARARGNCPFQLERLCEVHAIRPLGCRVYFCDASAQEWQQGLYERLLRELRAIHDRHGIEYRYGEWRGMLEMFI